MQSPPRDRLRPLITAYTAVAVATVVTLAILSTTEPDQAPVEAWVHALIVVAFAVLLPLRLRAARRGSVRALRAIRVIAAVLLVVNVIGAAIPGLYPIWMRIEMVAIAILMAGVVAAVARWRP